MDDATLKSVREEVDSATYGRTRESRRASGAGGSGSGRILGPSLPQETLLDNIWTAASSGC